MGAVEIKKTPDPEMSLLPHPAGMKDLHLRARKEIRNPVASRWVTDDKNKGIGELGVIS